jgi:hypothetical protein
MLNLVVRIVTTVESRIIHVKTCVMCVENPLLLSTEKTRRMSDRLTCSSEEEEIPDIFLVAIRVV